MKLNSLCKQLTEWVENNENKKTNGSVIIHGVARQTNIGEYEHKGQESRANEALHRSNVCSHTGEKTGIAQSQVPYVGRSVEKVVGGEILWKPIDRAAAMLLAKAPWQFHPPYIPAKKEESIKPKKPKKKIMGNIEQPNAGVIVRDHSNEEINNDLCAEMVKRTSNTVGKTEDLLNRTLDARAAMDVLCDQWKATWLDFQSTCNDRLNEMRMTRLAIDMEMRHIMSQFREVRTFFLDKDYEVERTRLREFVEVCEKLQQLKKDGFLDDVADTLLKLAK